MAMDLTGAIFKTESVKQICDGIADIGKAVESIVDSAVEIMKKIATDSDGNLIDLMTDGIQKLYDACKTLVACILDIGLHIGDYITTMLTQDQEAASTLRSSIESRLY